MMRRVLNGFWTRIAASAALLSAFVVPGIASAATINIIPSGTFQTLRVEATSPFVFPDSAPDLVVNGSFESPLQTSGQYSTYTGSPAIPGWSTGVLGMEIRNNLAGVASDGKNFVELDTSGNSFIEQKVATEAGKLYALSFDFSPRPGVNWNSLFLGFPIGSNGETNKISVFWGGLFLGTVYGSNAGNNDWTSIIAWNLPGAAGGVTLRFEADGFSDSYGGSLDNVQVSAVPLPPIVWMLGASMLGWLAFTRNAGRA